MIARLSAILAPRGLWLAGRIVLALLACGLGLGLAVTLWDPQRLPLTVAVVALSTTLLVVTLDPLIGLGTWVALSPFTVVLDFDIHLGAGIPDLALTRLAAGWTVVLLVARAARGGRRLAPLNLLDVTLILFSGAILLSAPSSALGTIPALQGAFDAYLLPFLAYALARNLVHDARAARWIVAVTLFICAYLAFFVLHEQLTGVPLFTPDTAQISYGTGLRRVVSLLGNPVFFGVPLDFGVIAGIVAISWQQRRISRTLLIGLVLFLLAAAFLTYNRASWLGVLLGLLVLATFYRGLRRALLPTLLVAAVLGALTWPVISQVPLVKERLAGEQSVDDRLNMIDIAYTLWRQQPLFGVGYGSFGYLAMDQGLYPRLPKYVPAPHNSFTYILTSGGLVAALPYVASFGVIGFDIWRFTRRPRQNRVQQGMVAAAAAILVAQIATSLTYDVAAGTLTSLMFYLFVGATVGLQQTTPV